jgi:hypothetical protein
MGHTADRRPARRAAPAARAGLKTGLKTRLRTRLLAAAASALALVGGCQDFLDVNTNPNAPQEVTANLYLAQMVHWFALTPQWDGRAIGRYTQQFTLSYSAANEWDRMGFVAGSDFGGEQWRTTYFVFGQNLVDMMRKAEAEQRWDLLGVGQVLKAWGWQAATDLHGEIIVKEAFNPTKTTFSYDSQEFAYQEVQRLLAEAVKNLQRTDGAVDQAFLARGDRLFNGDRSRWLKLAYGMLAMNLNHYSNKASLYRPDSVIALVDRSFASATEDAVFAFGNTNTDDFNFIGQRRANFTPFRQTRFALGLLDGTAFGGVVDPRLSRMLAPSPDGQYRGYDPNVIGFGGLTAQQQPLTFHGYAPTVLTAQQTPGRYLFDDKTRQPVMTYSQLQFVKAEAAYRKGDRATALAAYRNGISGHIDFVNARNAEANQNIPLITTAERNAFLASPAIVPAAGALSLRHIMSQKYIAQWAWGHHELWMDMRRYGYVGTDPATGEQIYPGFAIPRTLDARNNGKAVQRLRARFNSEYVWNQEALRAIGGLDDDFHTDPLWITQP